MNDKLDRAKKMIIDNCGASARRILDAGHRYLVPKTINALSRTSPERQRYEIEQVLAGRRPFSSKTEVYDTVSFGEVTSRLARAAGSINKAASQSMHTVSVGNFAEEDVRNVIDVVHHLTNHCGQLWKLIRSGDWKTEPTQPSSNPPVISDERIWSTDELVEADLKTVMGNLNRAASFIAKCVRDLPRADNLPRTREQVHAASVRLFGMRRNLWRMETTLARASGRVAIPNQKKRVATQPEADTAE